MECVEFEKLLQQRLDERLAPRCPELDGHAAACSNCELLLDDTLLLSRGITAWRASRPISSPELTIRITEQVLAVIHDEQPVRTTAIRSHRDASQSTAPRTWQTWAALAGTVAAVWFVFLSSPVRDQTDRQTPAVVRVGSPGLQSQPKADLGAMLVSAEGAYSHLANESLAAAQDFALLWPVRSPSSTADERRTSQAEKPKAEEEESHWSPDLSDELSPISDSVEDAWNFLRRTVPQVEKMRT